MVRASRIALVLGFVVLAAASSTAAGASGSPVVEAGGAHPVPDPRWLELASTYDAACSASDADPAKYVQCIAMHVDASVSAPAHATDATCVLASLVTDDALGLANCRFVAQHLGRTAFDAVAAGASPAEAETAARDAFRACHASFCDGGCAQGVLVGMLVRAAGEVPGSSPGGDALAAGGGVVPARAFRRRASRRGRRTLSAAAYAADAADAPSPVNCAAGIGQGLFAASRSPSSSCVAVPRRRRRSPPARGRGPGGGRGGGGEAPAPRLAFPARCCATRSPKSRDSRSTRTRPRTRSEVRRPRRSRGRIMEARLDVRRRTPRRRTNERARRGVRAVRPARRRRRGVRRRRRASARAEPGAVRRRARRAMAMLTAPSFTDDDAEAAEAVPGADVFSLQNLYGGVAERLCGTVADPVVAGACAEAAMASAAARETPRGAAFPFCGTARPEEAAAADDANDADGKGTAPNATRAAEATARAERDARGGGERRTADRAANRSRLSISGSTGARSPRRATGSASPPRAGERPRRRRPLLRRGGGVPHRRGSAAHHRAEDDGIAAAHARAVAAMEASLRAGDESLTGPPRRTRAPPP